MEGIRVRALLTSLKCLLVENGEKRNSRPWFSYKIVKKKWKLLNSSGSHSYPDGVICKKIIMVSSLFHRLVWRLRTVDHLTFCVHLGSFCRQECQINTLVVFDYAFCLLDSDMTVRRGFWRRSESDSFNSRWIFIFRGISHGFEEKRLTLGYIRNNSEREWIFSIASLQGFEKNAARTKFLSFVITWQQFNFF